MTYLVFFSDINGHNLEYCHHIYNVSKEIKKIDFVFVVPEDFLLIRDRLIWDNATNIIFDYIDKRSFRKINNKNLIARSYNVSLLFKTYYKRYNPCGAFVSTLNEVVPMLPFVFYRRANISGIIYRIYLYEWKESSIVRRIIDASKMYLLSKSKLFSNILILNDSVSSRYLNNIYSTNKFKDIIDPYIPLIHSQNHDFRREYSIPTDSLLYSHIGSMNESKGTIDLLKALKRLVSGDVVFNDVVFAFVGKISDEINDEFYELIEQLTPNVKIIVKNEFCDYDTIANLCYESNLLILPYKRTSQSSGIIGYASQFSVPFLMPKKGLLKRLVRAIYMEVIVLMDWQMQYVND